MKNITAYLVLISIGTAFHQAKAQVDPLYAQYLNNPLLINPAYSGYSKNLHASLSYRKQWAGFEGSPSTTNVNAHMSLRDNRMGLGLIVLQDNIGSQKNIEVQGTYSYRIQTEKQLVSFGLQAGALNYRTDYSDLNPYDPFAGDFSTGQGITLPSFGAGIIVSSERYFVGFSVPRMLASQVTINGTDTQLYRKHFYFSAAYVFFISEQLRLKPSVLVKGVKGGPVSVDYNLLLNISEKYAAGVYTRNAETYGILAQLKLNDRYRFGYAFEVPTNQSVGARFTTHELTLGVNLSVLNFHQTSVSSF